LSYLIISAGKPQEEEGQLRTFQGFVADAQQS
jgi:hypothetical protein